MDGNKPEIWISDLYSSQANYPTTQWQVCLAHQLRDCKYAIEAGDGLFAPIIKIVYLCFWKIVPPPNNIIVANKPFV